MLPEESSTKTILDDLKAFFVSASVEGVPRALLKMKLTIAGMKKPAKERFPFFLP